MELFIILLSFIIAFCFIYCNNEPQETTVEEALYDISRFLHLAEKNPNDSNNMEVIKWKNY
jgi:hypothetical protein